MPKFKVVNDHVKRGVALIQEYSGLMTKDEQQLQFLLRNVKDYQKKFPESRGGILLNFCTLNAMH